MVYVLTLIPLLLLRIHGEELNFNKFPDGFIFGAASSAFQTEGAWNENGKGENTWDRFTHQKASTIPEFANADVACDSYHKLEEDITIIKELGLANNLNPDGIRFYNNLIDSLLIINVIPMATLFHFDTPQPIEELGGFTNPFMVEWFEEYAKIAFENFGDRVKYWLTFSDPYEMCRNGYGGPSKAPGLNSSGVGDYMCGHNVLKSHARVYHLYQNTFKEKQKGNISIALEASWGEPASNSVEDIAASNRAIEFQFAWFADPIFHPNGDYPKSMKTFVSKRSKAEEFPQSRLPEFTSEEVEFIKGTYDYFALNYFASQIVADVKENEIGEHSFGDDLRAVIKSRNNASNILTTSQGLRKILKWIRERYDNPKIIVVGNGFVDHEELRDENRITYHKHCLNTLLDSIYKDEVRVVGYAIWSLMDSFEWNRGYEDRYGLYHVNFAEPSRRRTPKSSAAYYKEVIQSNRYKNGGGRLTETSILLIIAVIIISL